MESPKEPTQLGQADASPSASSPEQDWKYRNFQKNLSELNAKAREAAEKGIPLQDLIDGTESDSTIEA